VSLLPDAIELVKAIKKAAVDAQEAAKPVQACFGKVVGESPLKILVEQKLLLGERQLVLSRNVTDFSVEMSANLVAGEGIITDGEDAVPPHSHAIEGKWQVTVHNGLAAGDGVMLLRQQGGQKYIVVDRVG
jgi:hypothetical protein